MIRTKGLAKTFETKAGPVEAVRGVDLHVREGELVAFLGPNGAGKSTTLRMLVTLVRPTSGTAFVAGHDVLTDPARVRERIGYIGQGHGAGHYHRVRDELVTQGCAYGLSRRAARTRADELLETLQLTALASRQSSTLSGGQRRRLDIALGLVHHPPLLFLDEPSTGLDPHSRANLWDHVLEVRERFGTTIFLTTHYLEEADAMAERVMIIDHGRVIADDTPARLKAEHAGDRVRVTLNDPVLAARAAESAQHISNGAEVRIDKATVHLRVRDGDAILPMYLRALDEAGIGARTASVTLSTLDDVFLTLTGRHLREDGPAPSDASAPAAEEVAV
jgi:ABC-2 type transport system ATP-binding protein